MKFHSLADLRAVKKDLAQEEKLSREEGPAKAPEPRRGKAVSHPSREEEHARNEGLRPGQRVRMMDTNDTGTLVGFGKGFYEIDLDGLVIRAVRSEFLPVDPEQDRRMYASVPSRARKNGHQVAATPANDGTGDLTVDLHLERIPGYEGIPEWAALDFQMDYFRRILRQNLPHRGRRITFVHGIGDGMLAKAVRAELNEAFAVSCTYTVGPFGATVVTIR